MRTVEIIAGLTLTLVAIYLFVTNSAGTSNIISGLASGYSQSVAALQGRGSVGNLA